MKKLIVLVVLAVSSVFSFCRAEVRYRITDLGTLGGPFSYAYGINDSGQVVGYNRFDQTNTFSFWFDGTEMFDFATLGGPYSIAYDINNIGQVAGTSWVIWGGGHSAFIYDGTTMKTLGTFGGRSSWARAINDSGQVAGSSHIPNGNSHAFWYDGTTMHDLGTLGGSSSQAEDINNSGQVVGSRRISTGNYIDRAFLYDGKRMIDLGTLGGSDSFAYAINDRGQIVGKSNTVGNSSSHAFLYDGTTMHDLGTLGGNYSVANGINDSGHVVGMSRIAVGSGTSHAFLYDETGGMLDLNDLIPSDPGWLLREAYDINSSGQIVGVGNIDGENHAFLLTPGPMPAQISGLEIVGADEVFEVDTSGYSAFAIYDDGSKVDVSDSAAWSLSSDEYCNINESGVLEISALDSPSNVTVHAEYNEDGVTVNAEKPISLLLRVQGIYTITNLGTLGGISSRAYGINDSGQVVGYSYTDGNLANHAFLYDGTEMIDLGTLGGSDSYAYAINNSGQVVGKSYTGSAYHAFFYDGTEMIDLGTLGGKSSYAYDINDTGQIVGESYPSGNNYYHAFMHDGTGMVDLGTLGGNLSEAEAINNSGEIAGRSRNSLGEIHAFLYDGTEMIGLGTLGGNKSMAYDINDSGQVVGKASDGSATYAFLYDGSKMRNLGRLGGSSSVAYGINDSGQVVGHIDGWTGQWSVGLHAFVYDTDKGMRDLNDLIRSQSGWEFIQAFGINSSGQIVGYGSIGGETRAFLLTPKPRVAVSPFPEDGENFVSIDTHLSWKSGCIDSNSIGYDVYFGTDHDIVYDANPADDPQNVYKGRQETNTFNPELLDYNTTYYWRIDQVNDYEVDQSTRSIWSFTTEGLPPAILTIEVKPDDIEIKSISPSPGEHAYYEDTMVELSATRYVNCPDVYRFDHWEGDIDDPNSNSAETTIFMNADKTITAVFVDDRKCGDQCHPNFLLGDFNHDCIINIEDFAVFASRWMTCTKPECD